MDSYDEALVSLFSVGQAQHLWCHPEPRIRSDLEYVLLGLADRTIRSAELERRLARELSSCLDCVQCFHGFLQQQDSDPDEWRSVLEYLGDANEARLLETMSLRLQPGEAVPLQLSIAFVELLNFPLLLRRARLFHALEACLTEFVLVGGRIAFQQNDHCGGLLLLCASSVTGVREWAAARVVALGQFSADSDELEHVVHPALSVLLEAERDQRVNTRSGGAASSSGLVIFQEEYFVQAVSRVLDCVPLAALRRYCQLHADLAGQLLQLTLVRVDEASADQGLGSLLTLLKGAAEAGGAVWQWDVDGSRGADAGAMGSPVQALDMLLGKGCGMYSKLSDVGMDQLLGCIRFLCQGVPSSARSAMQDKAIKYLLCEFPDAPGNAKYAAAAQRTAASVIAEGCKAGFLPLQSQVLWAKPLVALAESESGVVPIVEWLLRKSVMVQGPLFPSVWTAVLTSKAVLPPGLHLALWKGQALFSFLVDTPVLADVRKLLAHYLSRIPTPAYWLSEAAVSAVHMMVVPNMALVPAMCRFFTERLAGDPALVRAVLDGMLALLQCEQPHPPRRLLALILRAWALVIGAADALKLSLTKVSNAMALFVGALEVEPHLSLATGTALKDCMLGLARLCTQDTRIALASSSLPALLRGAGIPAHAVQQVMAALKPLAVVTAVPVREQDPVALPQAPRRRMPDSMRSAMPPMFAGADFKKRRVVGDVPLLSEETRAELGLARAFPSTHYTGQSAPMLTPQQIRERNEFVPGKAGGGGGGGGAGARPRVRVAPAPRKTVQPLLPASPGLGDRRSSAQERELRNRQRLLPSRNALLQYVLGWTLAELTSDRSDPSLALQEIPDRFASTEQYVSVFEPLLLAEMRAVLQKDVEENEGEPALEMALGNVTRKDPFRALTLRVALEKGQVAATRNPIRDHWSVDDVIELRPSAGDEDAGMLGVVTKIEWLAKERLEEAHVLVAPRGVDNVQWVPHWQCRCLSSVVTSSREYRSMMSIKHLPVRDYVLGGPKQLEPQASLPVPKLLHQRFNESQASAIVKCLQQPRGFTLIQGPPGTGKTLTILGIVGALLMSNRHERSGERVLRKRILLCAASNKAVDEVTARLMPGVWDPFRDRMEDVAVVRVGREEAVSEAVKPVMLERLAADRCASRTQRAEDQVLASQARIKELEARLSDADKEIAELEATQVGIVALRNSSEDVLQQQQQQQDVGARETELAQKIRDLYHMKSETRQTLKRARDSRTKALGDKSADLAAAREDVVRCADVVCTTLSGAGSDLLIKCDLEFDAVIIDEATQATELQALIPLKYRSKLCVLVGDPKQLPATVMSRAAEACSFRQSLFQRLQRLGVPVSMLRMQYRMHPAISAFPNAEFYEGQLIDGPKVRVKKAYHEHALFGPFLFIDVKGVEERQGGHSAMNRAEATLTAALTRSLMAQFGAQVSGGVAVITPYKRQMHLLEQLIGSALPSSQKAAIEINTIDGFQGCEKDVVFFSCVRSHSGSSIGFLDDVRRLNVAITRARFALIVLGDAELLSKHPTFASLVAYAQRTHCFMSAIEAERCLSGGGGAARERAATATATPSPSPSPLLQQPSRVKGSAAAQSRPAIKASAAQQPAAVAAAPVKSSSGGARPAAAAASAKGADVQVVKRSATKRLVPAKPSVPSSSVPAKREARPSIYVPPTPAPRPSERAPSDGTAAAEGEKKRPKIIVLP